MRRSPPPPSPPSAADVDAALRGRLARLRGLARHVATLPPRAHARARRDVADEALALLPPLAWLLPYSLSILLARYGEQPTCRERRGALFDALAALAAPPVRAGRGVIEPADERPRYGIERALAVEATCSSRFGPRVCGAPAAYVVTWTWRRGRVSKPHRAPRCSAHGETFARQHGLDVPGV